jgi:hypothetical protein
METVVTGEITLRYTVLCHRHYGASTSGLSAANNRASVIGYADALDCKQRQVQGERIAGPAQCRLVAGPGAFVEVCCKVRIPELVVRNKN